MTDFRSRPLVILGAGYAGKFLYSLAKAQGWRTYATSRNPASNLSYVAEEDRLGFNLESAETWASLPKNAHVMWCFPALPQGAADRLIQHHAKLGGRLLLLGSTSAYGREHIYPVDEHTPLDCSLPRVRSEEHLRTTYGAIILRLAGLYGPGRHVLDWMRRGKVKNTQKYVNLIHIEDVASICLAALEKADDGEAYIVSDGKPRQWSEIFSVAERRWAVACPPLSPSNHGGKRLIIDKLRSSLNHVFLHADLYEALDIIEKCHTQSK